MRRHSRKLVIKQKKEASRREASFFAHFSKLDLGLAVVLAGDVASHRVHDDGRAEHDEQHRDDELQAVGDKHRAPGRLARGDGDGSGILDGAHHGHQALDKRCERDAKHDDERREKHLVAAARDLEEDAQRDEHERGEQLVRRAEQRPDVGVADLREHVAEHERQHRGEIRVAQELAPGLGVGHVVHAEKLLEAHARDTRDGVKAREGEGGDAHRHKDRGGVVRHAEHLEEARNAAAEDLERGTSSGGTVSSSGCTGNAEGQNSQQAFPFALRALQDFRRGNHQHLKPPLLHITEQFLYIRAKQQRRSLRRVADALLLDQPAQLVGRAAAGVALPKHCGGVLGVILVKALYRHCASPPFSGEIICLIKAMRSQPDASVTVLEPTLKIEIPFRSISARKAFTSSLS